MRRPNHTYCSLFLLIISFVLFCSIGRASAQTKNIAEQPDTIPLLCGIQVSADLAGVAQVVLSNYGQYEAALRVSIKDKYFPVFELGIGKAKHDDELTGIHYDTSSPYARIGMDVNILRKRLTGNRLYVGARYAFSPFKYTCTALVKDPVWGSTGEYGYSGIKASMHWAELVFGAEAKVTGPVHVGWSFRYRQKISADFGDFEKAWYIPGYGKDGSSSLSGTFYVGIEI